MRKENIRENRRRREDKKRREKMGRKEEEQSYEKETHSYEKDYDAAVKKLGETKENQDRRKGRRKDRRKGCERKVSETKGIRKRNQEKK